MRSKHFPSGPGSHPHRGRATRRRRLDRGSNRVARSAGWARCEDRIRILKDTGLENLPLQDFDQNRIWRAVVALAVEVTAWMQMLALTPTTRPVDGSRNGYDYAWGRRPARSRL
ncbi:hypothetical protein G9373_43615 [Rhodococcus sp. A14]|nr:hypothetical protein [Rhodococcus sp. A14]